MKTIGIMTFWGVPNYGTFLQAYALKNVVEKQINDVKCEVIPYLNNKHYKKYYGLTPLSCRFKFLRIKFYLSIIEGLKKLPDNRKKEQNFLRYYSSLSFSSRIDKRMLKKKFYDTVILGSDIIWDFSIPFFNKDKYLFGVNLNCNKKISYAASFGTVKYGDVIPQYVKKGILELDKVSVRESNSVKIASEITGKKPSLVCDPTFLWDFNTDENIKIHNKYGRYIVVYGSDLGKDLIQGCICYAKEHKLKIICLDSHEDSYDWCDINIKQSLLSPFEWLGLFKNSEIVFTCTYHGFVFGLIFNKRIVFNPLKFIIDKAESFIKFLDIEEPFVKLASFSEKADWEWDYSKINNKIKEIRVESLNYLIQNV